MRDEFSLLSRALRAGGVLLVSLLVLFTQVSQARTPSIAEGQNMSRLLVACRGFIGPFDPLVVDTFSMTDGSFVQQYDYRTDLPSASILQCPFRNGSARLVLSADLVLAVTIGRDFAVVSQGPMVSPIMGDPNETPQFYPNIPASATRVIGLWQYSAMTTTVVVQNIDPLTLAQTTLWTDFQPDTDVGIAGRGLSRDGNTFYYTQGTPDVIYALNLTTGVSTAFITAYAAGAFVNNWATHGLAQLPDGTFLVLWQLSGGVDLRLVQYDADGNPDGIDILLSGFNGFGSFIPDVDGSGVWVMGYDTGPTLRRYLLPSGTLDVNVVPPDSGAVYTDLAIMTPFPPVPTRPPQAPQAPCDPEQTSGLGGKTGCNLGGVGWTSLYDGPYGDVPSHPDPVDGEALTDKPALDIWTEWRPRDSGSPEVVYRRSFRELGHLPTYEGGRKTAGTKSIGDVENALGSEVQAFETSTVTIEHADQEDRLVRILTDGQSIKKDEYFVKGATPEGVAANAAPRIFARSIIEQARLTAPMSATITATDQIAAQFAEKSYPTFKVKDIGGGLPVNCPQDSLEALLKPLYGEKSDHGADPSSKGVIPGIYVGTVDLTSLGLDTPPDTPGYEFSALVAALQASVDAHTTDADWGGCIGHADAAVLEAMGTVPNDYTRLAQVIGYGDLDALLDGSCGSGTTAPPDDTAWGLILFGLGDWYSLLEIFGSDLQSGDAIVKQDRVLLDPNSRSDILAPGYIWPFATNYIELTNPDTGRVFWVTGIYVKGGLLTDHIAGKISLACNAMGLKGMNGYPIIDAHAAEFHWHTNFVQRIWSSGSFADNSDFPQWSDGTAKVRSSSFAARQAYTADRLGGRGLKVGWFPDAQRSIKAWIEAWDRETESKTGINGHWQVLKYGFDDSVDPTLWRRIDHPEHVFGKLQFTPGQDPENVAIGSCDWDDDARKYRAGPFTRRNDDGLDFMRGDEVPGDAISSTILNDSAQMAWVLDERLRRLRYGSTFIEVPGPIGFMDSDVGDGVQLSTIEGTGANGWTRRKGVILRRRFSFQTRIVTLTVWDVERLLA